jgi:protein TonB
VAKDINLNSQAWRDLVFEGKNKSYGAYKMRATSSKRHVIAFIVIILFVVFVAFLPALIKTVESVVNQNNQITTQTKLSDIKLEELKKENIVYKEQAPPPPKLKNTIKYTPPVITDDALVNEADEMKSQSELQESKVTVSVADVKGSEDADAVDIADLEDNKVVAEEKPFYAVEQDPVFPGGPEELANFIGNNLRYPNSASELGIEGRVLVRFVVSKTGEVSAVSYTHLTLPTN